MAEFTRLYPEYCVVAYTTEELGRLIARAHYQAWRLDAPPFDLTPEELAAILPNLIKSGSAGIVWHRVKPVRERYGAMAYALEAATEAQIAHNQKVEEAVVECVTRLRAYGIEPVLVKGLALAKLYPEGIVRPAGDIDLVVRKDEFAAAQAILHDSSRRPITVPIDLHRDAPSPPDEGAWDEVPNNDFWNRLTSLDIGDSFVSALDVVDNFQMVCFHFMKHGGQRPLWLTDIGAVIDDPTLARHTISTERVPAPIFRNWFDLLEVTLPDLAREACERTVPNWLQDLIYTQWLTPSSIVHSSTLHQIRTQPCDTLLVFKDRWPSPLAACFWEARQIQPMPPTDAQVKLFLRRVLRRLNTAR